MVPYKNTLNSNCNITKLQNTKLNNYTKPMCHDTYKLMK